MTTIETRENRSGNWWCNTTIGGLDISVEGRTVKSARAKILRRLKLKSKDVTWSSKKRYQCKPAPPSHMVMGYGNIKLDHL